FGQVEEIIKAYRPLPDGVPERNDWANEAVAITRLEQHFTDVMTFTATVPWNFASAGAATEFLFTNSASHIAACSGLDPAQVDKLTAEVERLTTRSSMTSDGIRIDLEYMILLGKVPA
ncbi:hypothetical protein, partial [Frankia sp. CcWB3]